WKSASDCLPMCELCCVSHDANEALLQIPGDDPQRNSGANGPSRWTRDADHLQRRSGFSRSRTLDVSNARIRPRNSNQRLSSEERSFLIRVDSYRWIRILR